MPRLLIALCVTAILTGCSIVFPGVDPPDNDGPSVDNPPVSDGPASLKRFTSEDEFRGYFADQVMATHHHYGMDVPQRDFEEDADGLSADEAPAPSAPGDAGGPVAVPPTGESNNDDFSDTTTQEDGVDEADVVKTDGAYLYVIDGQRLHIVQTDPAESFGEVSALDLEGYGQDMYLLGDKVVTITSRGGGFYYMEDDMMAVDVELAPPMAGDDDVMDRPGEGIGHSTDWSDGDSGGAPEMGPMHDGEPMHDDEPMPDVEPRPDGDGKDGLTEPDIAIEPGILPAPMPMHYERPSTVVTVIDVTDRAAPVVLSTTRLAGSISSSRMIGGMLHVVLANYPDYWMDVLPALGRPEMDVSRTEAASFVPDYTRLDGDGTVEEGALVTWASLYRPADPDGFGMVTVVSMDIEQDAEFTAVGVVAQPSLIYSSLDALYVTDASFDFSFAEPAQRQSTDIYKFRYTDHGVEPAGAGSVPGRILNQYSMSEHDGYLRVASTIGSLRFLDGDQAAQTNSVYVLAENDEGLSIVGRVENIAPDERIQSARFMGDRGYLVTFRQVDPLFTLDLSDPTAPRVVGELKVPGFSTFLVQMDEDHLLAVGRYVPPVGPQWPQSVQLSIFDISDFANPTLAHNLIIEEGNAADSEALWNPKAFTYYAQQGKIALPLSVYHHGEVDFEVIDLDMDDVVIDEDGGRGDSGESSGSDDVEPQQDEPAPPPDEDIDILPYDPSDDFHGLVVYDVSTSTGFAERGRIDARTESGFGYPRWPSFTRGVFIGDNVYVVTDIGVQRAPVDQFDVDHATRTDFADARGE